MCEETGSGVTLRCHTTVSQLVSGGEPHTHAFDGVCVCSGALAERLCNPEMMSRVRFLDSISCVDLSLLGRLVTNCIGLSPKHAREDAPKDFSICSSSVFRTSNMLYAYPDTADCVRTAVCISRHPPSAIRPCRLSHTHLAPSGRSNSRHTPASIYPSLI